ncbi:uncharacterized protein LOC116840400 isoform X1 [Odontomachus brunneus]|uniref:uncharacterized protein LOC116840400 isoform X1 n=1 Tax=Odontomachus brunneus TaxID=486640 RepID=UPI0013F1A5DD|nr:uncharacterized protein LOC116840400 isoform X1 [Odontomachus brunneus]
MCSQVKSCRREKHVESAILISILFRRTGVCAPRLRLDVCAYVFCELLYVQEGYSMTSQEQPLLHFNTSFSKMGRVVTHFTPLQRKRYSRHLHFNGGVSTVTSTTSSSLPSSTVTSNETGLDFSCTRTTFPCAEQQHSKKHHIREWRLNNIKTTCEHNRHHEVCAIIVSWKKEKRTEKRKRGSERGRRRAEKKACRNK